MVVIKGGIRSALIPPRERRGGEYCYLNLRCSSGRLPADQPRRARPAVETQSRLSVLRPAELAYHVGYVDRFCSASFKRLDLLAQVAGEIGAVSRLGSCEVKRRRL